MFRTRQLRMLLFYIKQSKNDQFNNQPSFNMKGFHTNSMRFTENKEKSGAGKEVTEKLSFETAKEKTKNSYLDMIRIYVNRDVHRRGHVEFIYSALKNMEQYGVHKDLEVYKAIVDVLPKGKFIPQNIFQAEFMHYPKQQQCVVDLLEQMEDNGVLPDVEMESMLLNIFGKRGIPLRKYWRMMYWMPKFKNLSPWPVPNPPPNDAFELAQLAIARISSVDVQTKLTIYQSSDIADSIEDTWIVSAQSPIQQDLLRQHNVKEPIYVEGPYRVWLRTKSVNYFMLRANPKIFPEETEDLSDDVSKIDVSFFNFTPPKMKSLANIPSIHEQNDATIFALCATGTSSKDSLLSWIRHLEKDGNSVLSTLSVVFTLKSSGKELTVESAGLNPEIDER
ncbi:evolutionarily conserved signaling intermediate in Toll pathway, mitochondrial-like [Onthophagus taurus]|uniref:evolutionarily conserved signaling intermediate in Toll pathway, mitochondrial-like n=1 Tax=Onthophagus taurus TaxID=166361 RepID=UPI000C20EF1F|nr:evolutionarily conserved signaling intermediate in Toll pathway, mitochondrial-like [Onthophagus taurus]